MKFLLHLTRKLEKKNSKFDFIKTRRDRHASFKTYSLFEEKYAFLTFLTSTDIDVVVTVAVTVFTARRVAWCATHIGIYLKLALWMAVLWAYSNRRQRGVFVRVQRTSWIDRNVPWTDSCYIMERSNLACACSIDVAVCRQNMLSVRSPAKATPRHTAELADIQDWIRGFVWNSGYELEEHWIQQETKFG